MKWNKVSAAIIITFLSAHSLYAGAGTTGGVVLKETVGARALALGDAFTAVATGADAVSWNPAGIATVEKKSISAMYMNEILDVGFMSLNAALPFGNQGIGMSIVNLSGGDIELNSVDGTSKTVNAENDYVLSAAYARTFNNFSGGITVKYLKSTLIETESATAFAADLGVQHSVAQVPGLSLAAVVQNVGTEIKYISEGDPLPLTAKVGGAYTLPLGTLGENNLLFSTDIIKPRELSVRANIGVEYTYNNFFSLRGGYKFNYDVDSFTAGFGLHLKNFILDYAFAPKDVLGDTYKVSLSLEF